ncbi:MAG TPA: glycerophosphodiester phosphodiesterase [Pyrinomonadaceae bacterium]
MTRDTLFDRDRSARHSNVPLVMAHRGGAGLWPENTMHAFERAVPMKVDVLEMDMRATADDQLVIIHDSTVDRTTNGSGPVSAMTLEELKRLDAGYRWSPDGGRSFPMRGRGLSVPTLSEIFNAFAGVRLNIDIKQESPSIVQPFCRMIREHEAEANLTVASFNQGVLDRFRAECAGVATSGSVLDIRSFLALETEQGAAETYRVIRALQVPEYVGGRLLVTSGFIEEAHRRGLEVHAWTINDEAAMKRLIELKIDGIITDFPDRLLRLLGVAGSVMNPS